MTSAPSPLLAIRSLRAAYGKIEALKSVNLDINPGEIVAQIRKRRISVLVSVPKILDVLEEHVTRTFGSRFSTLVRNASSILVVGGAPMNCPSGQLGMPAVFP